MSIHRDTLASTCSRDLSFFDERNRTCVNSGTGNMSSSMPTCRAAASFLSVVVRTLEELAAGKVDTITGATISSTAVTEAVQNGIKDLKLALGGAR